MKTISRKKGQDGKELRRFCKGEPNILVGSEIVFDKITIRIVEHVKRKHTLSTTFHEEDESRTLLRANGSTETVTRMRRDILEGSDVSSFTSGSRFGTPTNYGATLSASPRSTATGT